MPRRRNYREEDLQAAIQTVKKGKGLREAARLHGVPPSTIKDRMKGRTPFHEVERTVITAREEDQLVAWIKECAKRGFGRSMSQVQRAVQTILNECGAVTVFKDNLPGKKWISLFMKRHRDVSFRTPQALGAQRAAVTVDKIGPSRLYATEVTETATEVTETATQVTETAPEVTETAPEVTETVTVVTDEPVTLNSSPPSPLPPLTLVTDETIDSSPPSPLPPLTVTPPPITTPEASHVNTPSLATVSTASTSNPCFITNRTEALDRLLDITAKAGVDKLIRYRTLNALRTPTDDPEERLFCLLYSKLTQPTDDESKGST
ncbi:hypothetical protein ACOMHN_008996 [Nucella lapillus]